MVKIAMKSDARIDGKIICANAYGAVLNLNQNLKMIDTAVIVANMTTTPNCQNPKGQSVNPDCL